jgi:hypothetical protein
MTRFRFAPRFTLLLALGLVLVACGASRSDGRSADRQTVVVDLMAQNASPTNSFSLVDLVTVDGTVRASLLATPEEIWAELPAVYDEIGLRRADLAVFEPAARRIGVREHRIRRLGGQRPSRFLRCGDTFGAPKADNGQLRISVTSTTQADDDGAILSTTVTGWTRDPGTSTGPLRCTSNGALEREIIHRVQLRLLDREG